MVDVIEVEIAAPHRVRVMERNKTDEDAEAIIKMAVARRGVEKHFYTKTTCGSYKDGDVLKGTRG